ncbi:hypothetical protein KUM39_08530 [Streptomyces sp. J2-1]|uniref:hypothetical protein n=1 Tax=Streptomyces corallincola TaxID=2851888 RepID=UPI001C37EE71|nr:hypothetical protein [Streptomyces corallincola]MBV2354409.1 hypothetical protein [Streptomyces corallincola]
MAVRRSRRAALLAVVATAALLTGCGSGHPAPDCLRTADAIADGVTGLQQAVEETPADTGRAGDSLDTIDRELRTIDTDDGTGGTGADDTALRTAVDRVGGAAATVRRSLHAGDRSPDTGPLTDAAGELTKVCKP